MGRASSRHKLHPSSLHRAQPFTQGTQSPNYVILVPIRQLLFYFGKRGFVLLAKPKEDN